ncbi:MAG: hypothetical protein AAB515_00275 [Patescibacteria group bacterium]
MPDALAKTATRFILREFVGDILLFPVWWFGKGLQRVGQATWARQVRFTNRSRWSPKVWFQNIFVPMYGDYSRSGRAISFFVRLVVALALSLVFIIYTLLVCTSFVLYLLLPLGVVYFFLRQLVGLPWPV